MGELARLDRGGSPPLPAAAAAYLATLNGLEQRNTQRACRSTLRTLTAICLTFGYRSPFKVSGFTRVSPVVLRQYDQRSRPPCRGC